ncbi:hypothetical protein ZIOFF_014574 [Zingiber officinale]|uniref:EamA domain-containing protein n=1 Tax=Zingiber officinale TaxID=94328 RepID=A0A8J5LS57_ZINOF|nr:hypothetical protein ZIOFF_014574 [Zingiber officinale]
MEVQAEIDADSHCLAAGNSAQVAEFAGNGFADSVHSEIVAEMQHSNAENSGMNELLDGSGNNVDSADAEMMTDQSDFVLAADKMYLAVAVPFVCKSWYRASLYPSCWCRLNFRSLDFTPWSPFSRAFALRYCLHSPLSFSAFLRFALHRSRGVVDQLAFPLYSVVSIHDLAYASMPEIEGAGFAGQPDAGGRPLNPGAGAVVEGSGASGDGDSWQLRPAHPLFLALLQSVLCYPHLPLQTFIRLSVEVPPAISQECYGEFLDEFSKKAKVPGFRQGKKVPENILLNYIGRQNIQQAFAYAGSSILGKLALGQGLSALVFVVYRHLIAMLILAPLAYVLERNRRPSFSFGVMLKIFILAMLGITIQQNVYYVGLHLISPTVASALGNVIPAFTFLLAIVLRMEKLNLKTVILLGAFVTSPMIQLHFESPEKGDAWLKGSALMLFGYFACSVSLVLQDLIWRLDQGLIWRPD